MANSLLSKRLLLGIVMSCAISLSAQEQQIDTKHSGFRIHVGKAGLFSDAAHEHWVRAPFAGGSLSDNEPAHISFQVHAKTLMVEPDDKLSADDQAKVQNTMQTQVLESDKYPEITFKSTKVELQQPNQWLVMGDLTLHGVTRTIHVQSSKGSAGYSGHTTLKQTDFGIHPVSIGGVVKVKNELDIEFTLVPE